MGLDHYLYRPDILPLDRFAAWTGNVRRVLDSLPALMICGEYDGDPVVTDELVAFNGNSVYTVQYADDPVAIYRDSARLAAFPASDEWDSDRAFPFHVARVFDQSFRSEDERGWLFDSFRTRQYPYDRAVVSALILFNHHFKGMCRVASDYTYETWRPALALTREATGLDVAIPFYLRGWQRPRMLPADAFCAWRDDVALVIAVAGVPLAEPDGTGEPVLTGAVVAFNGVGDDAEEPLRISRDYDPADGGHGMGSDEQFASIIRTMGNMGKRYDIVVAAALLLLAVRLPQQMTTHDNQRVTFEGFGIHSGGMGHEEWLPALQLAANATGRMMTMPRMWS